MPGEDKNTMSERMFPIQVQGSPGSPSAIPWRLLDEGWAQHNHGQSLTRLAERGGLSPGEAMANIERRGWESKKYNNPGAVLATTVRADEVGQLRGEIARLTHGLDLIHRHGGKTTDEGLSCNGSWCAEQARATLQRT